MKLKQHIFLIGFMGCGKSTNAARLSELTGAGRLEMDEEIVKRQGMEIRDIFSRFGEEFFRDLETGLIAELETAEPLVISCGGGAVLREQNVRMMKKMGKIVLLTADPETIYERIKDSTDRPVLNGHMNPEYIRMLMEKRRNRYEAAADFSVSTDRKTADVICREILALAAEQEEQRQRHLSGDITGQENEKRTKRNGDTKEDSVI